jgi:hypothetical protein
MSTASLADLTLLRRGRLRDGRELGYVTVAPMRLPHNRLVPAAWGNCASQRSVQYMKPRQTVKLGGTSDPACLTT